MDGARGLALKGTTAGSGLTSAEAARRLVVDGPNVLPEPNPPSALHLLAAQMFHFFALLLWGAATLALIGGMPQLAVAIVVVVLVNGCFAFAQEWRADRAAQSLRRLLPAAATVRRDGHRLVVPVESLVRDDVVLLEAGDRVSADLELVLVGGLAVDESMLTGESRPVRAKAGDRVHAGTFVVEGEAEAFVRAVGGATRLADIAAMTRATRHPRGPLALQLVRVVRAVAVIAVSAGGSFFALSLVLGMPASQGFLFAVGVSVALVPEGLLPTVTLSLARAAQRMAHSHALVRRLDAVESIGATTFVCSDKTGTLTQNRMSVVEVWTPLGAAGVSGAGYEPVGQGTGTGPVRDRVAALALAAARASSGRVRQVEGEWTAAGDPMEVALHVLALRCGVDVVADEHCRPVSTRFPFDPQRRRMSAVAGSELFVKGAPDAVLPLCLSAVGAVEEVGRMSSRGLRVLAVARRPLRPDDLPLAGLEAASAERGLELLGLVGIEDPPRPDVREAIASCRRAGVRIAMVTGDHPGTARTVAAEVGLLGADPLVLEESSLPSDEAELGALLDHDGVVIARVTPEGKLRIARALRARGHVVAMTGDGVNDGPALREADVGVAMGLSGTDTAREAADLVLLDDHFATIVTAIEQGRATFANIRRFLTYHLTDNVAELTPFVVWAASGGSYPLALSVLQVLALDIGTDLLPALALGGEPANPRTMSGSLRTSALVDRRLLTRVFGVLGPAEAVVEMAAFTAVLLVAGWTLGAEPSGADLAAASGAAFSAVVLGQLANAYACRSETRWVGRVGVRGNPLLAGAVAVELVLLGAFLMPPLAGVLGGSPPPPLGWVLAALAVPAVVLADAAHKGVRARRRRVS
ncbi:MAG TPA: cation-transporting P-type ATPase [Jiangellales bacterium]|nr:cation-transporting P-type ATPase [Jiangellales bacterium]